MVGLPRSGKSTAARKLAVECGAAIVNPDSIRLSLHGHRYLPVAEKIVWAIVDLMIRSLFEAGHRYVILDGCHNTKKRRDEWKNENWRLYFAPVYTDREVCLKRARDQNDEEIIPTIERMAAQHEPLTEEESHNVVRIGN